MEAEVEGDRSGPIKYNYFPIEWKLFGNERRAIDDIHTFIKRARFSDRPCPSPSYQSPASTPVLEYSFPFQHLVRNAILHMAQKRFWSGTPCR